MNGVICITSDVAYIMLYIVGHCAAQVPLEQPQNDRMNWLWSNETLTRGPDSLWSLKSRGFPGVLAKFPTCLSPSGRLSIPQHNCLNGFLPSPPKADVWRAFRHKMAAIHHPGGCYTSVVDEASFFWTCHCTIIKIFVLRQMFPC